MTDQWGVRAESLSFHTVIDTEIKERLKFETTIFNLKTVP